jgi:hypothetical protein
VKKAKRDRIASFAKAANVKQPAHLLSGFLFTKKFLVHEKARRLLPAGLNRVVVTPSKREAVE